MKKLILWGVLIFLAFFIVAIAQEDPCPDCGEDWVDDYFDDHDDCDDDDYDDGSGHACGTSHDEDCDPNYIDNDDDHHGNECDDICEEDFDDCEDTCDAGENYCIDECEDKYDICVELESNQGGDSGSTSSRSSGLGGITGKVVIELNKTIEENLTIGSEIIVGKTADDIDTQSAKILLKSAADTIAIPTLKEDPIKTDNQASIGTENYIVIGGPCSNQLANKLLGNPNNCAEGFEEGKAILQLFETGDKQALLIAGYSGEDTKRAVEYLISRITPIKGKIVIDTNSLQIVG